jgi:uncharacterized protein (UPF0332 family)
LRADAARILGKAQRLIGRAVAMADDGYLEEAAREAYLATFHAARAFVLEHTGATPKTHSGLRSTFAQAARRDTSLAGFGRFLTNAYKVKETHDYDEIRTVPDAVARATIEKSRQFVDRIAAKLSGAE